MDISNRNDNLNPDLACPACGSQARTLVGAEEERRRGRLKCRKCDAGYWENLGTGMVQGEKDRNG